MLRIKHQTKLPLGFKVAFVIAILAFLFIAVGVIRTFIAPQTMVPMAAEMVEAADKACTQGCKNSTDVKMCYSGCMHSFILDSTKD